MGLDSLDRRRRFRVESELGQENDAGDSTTKGNRLSVFLWTGVSGGSLFSSDSSFSEEDVSLGGLDNVGESVGGDESTRLDSLRDGTSVISGDVGTSSLCSLLDAWT